MFNSHVRYCIELIDDYNSWNDLSCINTGRSEKFMMFNVDLFVGYISTFQWVCLKSKYT